MHPPVPPPAFDELFRAVLAGDADLLDLNRRLVEGGGPFPSGRYRHWDKLRHLEPPAGLGHERWWLALKLWRLPLLRPIPLRDRHGAVFRFAVPDMALRMLHDIDRRASGTIAAPEQVTDPQTRDTYLIRSLMEEAITSSQLEGAATTRRVAKEMLQSGRKPRDRNERMIANNYGAMHLIRERTDVPLSSDLLLELHRVVTEDTLKDAGAVGRFRTDRDDVVVEDAAGHVLHVPPDASELSGRIEALCRFANDRDPKAPFVHPVVRAILLHFWLAYDHPFVDGNGRTARALFYWSMARDGYWLLEYVSISRILRAAPSRYARSFLYTETDDNDATYFVLNQLDVVRRAIDDLYVYLGRKARELGKMRKVLDRSGALRGVLNHRQVAVVHHALRHPHHTYTIRSHRHSHGVSYQTARTDLLALAELGLLVRSKLGRAFVFDVPADLQERLARLEEGREG